MSMIKFTRMGKEIELDTKEALLKIRKVLERYNYEREGDGLTDAIIYQMATFSVLVDGLLWNHEVNDNLTNEMATAIQVNWYAMKALIEEREEEHSRLWDIAFARGQ